MTEIDVSAVEAVNAEFYAAFESADLDRMGLVWADGPHAEDVVCVHPGWPPLRGRGTVLRSWALIMANTPYIQFVLTDMQVRISGDQAVVTCSENIITAVEESADSLTTGGSMVTTNVFIRTDEGWRMWLHHGSPVLNREEEDDEDGH
ncbi:nuclear transport factor 2 family protein [Actinoallomurus iriomotensis]|uniref:3-dehydroquinate dehydratase n=1 Tax=Actinoallomurus iriomotensis TaxID=478107 RepID=A0A9W6RQ86_9ACTN|nr:nuclear transport factor 2 family protein [Actinoallomurus iriomotensis]GLY79788.1 3-dehydroquinate dehydratase [Actinoallomurus iriomotensis]GLY88469.1 3-dehydroquinate dehydratase [Actinoallomurus iriomotensis]